MPIELTEDERRVMVKALLASTKKVTKTPKQVLAFADEIYRAGMAAGIERAAMVCDTLPSAPSETCATAIRALLKPLP